MVTSRDSAPFCSSFPPLIITTTSCSHKRMRSATLCICIVSQRAGADRRDRPKHFCLSLPLSFAPLGCTDACTDAGLSLSLSRFFAFSVRVRVERLARRIYLNPFNLLIFFCWLVPLFEMKHVEAFNGGVLSSPSSLPLRSPRVKKCKYARHASRRPWPLHKATKLTILVAACRGGGSSMQQKERKRGGQQKEGRALEDARRRSRGGGRAICVSATYTAVFVFS